jgi:hypothetical protein
MSTDISKILEVMYKVGSVSGLLSIIFTFRNQMRKRSKFKFDFKGSVGEHETRDELDYYNLTFNGYVKNQSNEQNSITEISYLIWGNKGRTKTLTNGGGAIILLGEDVQKKISLPILFEAKEGKHLIIQFSICLTGTHVRELVQARKPVRQGSPYTLPEHEFSLSFKDVNEILFDDKGSIRSQKLINLWWTLPNSFNSLKMGKPIPYIKHMVKIMFTYLVHKIFSICQRLGL